MQRAETLQQLGRHHEALELLAAAIQEEPFLARIHSLRSSSLSSLQRIPEAIEAANEALRLNPDDSYGLFALAKAMFYKGDHLAARKRIRDAIKLYPLHAPYHAFLANTYYWESRNRKALSALAGALQLDPNNTTCLFLQAQILFSQGKKAEAERAVRCLLGVDPNHATGLALLHSIESPGAAGNPLRQALQTDPRHPYVRGAAEEQILNQVWIFRWIGLFNRTVARCHGPVRVAILFIGAAASYYLRHYRPDLLASAIIYAPVCTLLLLILLYFFDSCPGYIYLRYHREGRWLLGGSQRAQAEAAAIGLALGTATCFTGLVFARISLMSIGFGIASAGCAVSKGLEGIIHPATRSEFPFFLALSALVILCCIDGIGLLTPAFVQGLLVCCLIAVVVRFAGWPRL
jgi:tetratricopeptide (TPR) repeat protein